MSIKNLGTKSSAQDNFLQPDNVASLTATDVGTNRPYLATANTTSAASASGTGGSVSLSWTQPGTVAATAYIITTTPSTYEHNTGSSSTSYTFEGLASNTSYTFTVKATNASGTSSGTTSSSVTATTVPATPAAPTISSVANQSTDVVTWTAPATGGKAISGYSWQSTDSKSGTTASTSVNVSQEAGTSQQYRVLATNANGNSPYSSYSSSFTSFSFTPFSFTPFSFVPYSFTPYAFTPYTFVPYGFTPYAFTPFFWLDGGNALAPEISIRSVSSEDGLININDIQVGHVLLAKDFVTNELVETTVTAVDSFDDDKAVMIDGEVYSVNHKVLVEKNGVESFISVLDIDTTFKKYSYIQEGFVDIFSIEQIEFPISAVNITCSPYNNFLTNDVILSD